MNVALMKKRRQWQCIVSACTALCLIAVAQGLAACGDEFTATSTAGDATTSQSTSQGGAGSTVTHAGSGGTPVIPVRSLPSVPPGCGDGVLAQDEQCDDGDLDDGDSCTAACRLAVCGDGAAWAESGVDFEQCDDGNRSDGDGCSANCRFEQCEPSPCDDLWPGGECVLGCDPQLCEGNELCQQAGIVCDGSDASECSGRCLLYAADCAAIKGWPGASESAVLRSCLESCTLLPP